MTRPELHTVRRAFFDCTSLPQAASDARPVAREAPSFQAKSTRVIPSDKMSYAAIKAALRLAA